MVILHRHWNICTYTTCWFERCELRLYIAVTCTRYKTLREYNKFGYQSSNINNSVVRTDSKHFSEGTAGVLHPSCRQIMSLSPPWCCLDAFQRVLIGIPKENSRSPRLATSVWHIRSIQALLERCHLASHKHLPHH